VKLLEVYLKEYIALVNHFLEGKSEDLENGLKIKEDVIYIRKELLFKYFSKNPYEKNQDKLLNWSKLHLIERESGSLSKKVYLGENKRVRMIVINRKTFECIVNLMEKEV